MTDNGAMFDVVVTNVAGTVTSATATLTVFAGGTFPVVDANFNAGADGFAYGDDLFKSTVQPNYASGTLLGSGGFTGGAVQVTVGGINSSNVANMSGGWQRSFSLASAGPATLTFRYNLTAPTSTAASSARRWRASTASLKASRPTPTSPRWAAPASR